MYDWYNSLGSFGLTLVWYRCVSQVLVMQPLTKCRGFGVTYEECFWKADLLDLCQALGWQPFCNLFLNMNQINWLLLLFTFDYKHVIVQMYYCFPFLGRAHALA